VLGPIPNGVVLHHICGRIASSFWKSCANTPACKPTSGCYHGQVMSDISRLLSAMQEGDPQAASQLLPLVYDLFPKCVRSLSEG
jgi:hypothetical protein